VTNAHQLRHSYEDYLRALDDSDIKLEYVSGLIYAMAGGTLVHAELSVAATSLLRRRLPADCSVFGSDAKVRVEASDFAGFPDGSVVCGQRKTSIIDSHALINPSLIVEVTSRSTEEYDRGEKLAHYKRLPSVQAVLFVSHRERCVSVVERRNGIWTIRDEREHVQIATPTISFSVAELYENIELDPS
jgi:Uma2 family endonuclease